MNCLSPSPSFITFFSSIKKACDRRQMRIRLLLKHALQCDGRFIEISLDWALTKQKIAFETELKNHKYYACSQQEQTFTANQTLDWNYTFLWIQICYIQTGRYCFFSLSKNSQSNNITITITFWSCWNNFVWISEEFLIHSGCLSVLIIF